MLRCHAIVNPQSRGSFLDCRLLAMQAGMLSNMGMMAGIPLQPLVNSQHCSNTVDNDAPVAPMRSRSRLAIVIIGMFTAYVAHDYVQELVFSYKSYKFGWFMSLVEVILITLASFVQLRYTQSVEPKFTTIVPSRTEAKCAVALAVFIALSLGTGSAAISHVSFPVKVVMKSSKLLPTMLIRRIFTGAKYNVAQVVAAIGTCFGCAVFALADSSASGGSRPATGIGIALLSVAVCADACAANTQEALLTRYHIPTSRMVITTLPHWTLMLFASLLNFHSLTCGRCFTATLLAP